MNHPNEHSPSELPFEATPESGRKVGRAATKEDDGFRIRDERASRAERRERSQRKRTAAMATLEDPRVAAVTRFVREQFEQRPYVSTGIALGIGFLIGGGLSTRVGRMALATVGRYALRELLKSRV